jgi:hypothetical protein
LEVGNDEGTSKGMGMIEALFRRNATSTQAPTIRRWSPGSSHNQILDQQLGLIGAITLVAMWRTRFYNSEAHIGASVPQQATILILNAFKDRRFLQNPKQLDELIHVELTEHLLAWQPVRIVSRLHASNSNDCMSVPGCFRCVGRGIIGCTKRIGEDGGPNSQFSL